LLVTVRRSKTNQDGTSADVRYLKNGAAIAVLAVLPAGSRRCCPGAPWARVLLATENLTFVAIEN